VNPPAAGFDGLSLVGLVLGGSLAWTLVYGFAVWFDVDETPPTARRLAAVAGAGAVAALALALVAAGLSGLIETVSGIPVPVWISLWVVAGPLGLLLTIAYHDRVGGDPAQWLGVGAVAGFAVWPAVEYLVVVVTVTAVG
jgi:hypothetical protein